MIARTPIYYIFPAAIFLAFSIADAQNQLVRAHALSDSMSIESGPQESQRRLSVQQAKLVGIDISACRAIYVVLRSMHDGAPKERISQKLDALLETRPYQIMFKHYNRSWRPNELPCLFSRE